jgi:hypothetical protein
MNPQSTVTGWLKLKSGNSNKFATINNANELLVHDGSTATLVMAMGAPGTAGTLLDYQSQQTTKLNAIDTKLGNTLAVNVGNFPASFNVGNFPAVQAVSQNGVWNVGITGSVAVTGAFYQATQPVSLAALPALVAGTAIIGKVGIDQTAGQNVVSVANFPASFNIGNGGLGTVASPLVVQGTTVSGTSDQGVHLASGAGFAVATPSYATLVVAGAAVAAGNPLPVVLSGTPITAATLMAGGTNSGIGWLSQIAYLETQARPASQNGVWSVGVNNFPADQGVHLASGAGFALATPSYCTLTLGGALVAAGNPLPVILSGNPIAANSVLGTSGTGGIGWLSQIDLRLAQLVDIEKPDRTGVFPLDTGVITTNAISANDWRTLMSLAVPAGQIYVPYDINLYSGTGGVTVRLAEQVQFGTTGFGNAPGWVDNAGYTPTPVATEAGDFFGAVSFEVTTPYTGGATPFNLTVSYINQDGNAATGTVTGVVRGAAAGNRYTLTLAAGDIGVRDVTGVTSNGGAQTAGAGRFIGTRTLVMIGAAVAGSPGMEPAMTKKAVRGGRTVTLDMTSNATASVTLHAIALGEYKQEL